MVEGKFSTDICVVSYLCQFSGERGERFSMACAKFCRDQQFALDQLRMFTDRETKIGLFIQVHLLLMLVVSLFRSPLCVAACINATVTSM